MPESAAYPVPTTGHVAEGAVDTTRPGLLPLAFRVETPSEVRAAEARLRELGVPARDDGVLVL